MRKRGFTLIEIIIVVSVIAILAVIAVPNLLRSRTQGNEAAAIENVRTIFSAEVTCHTARKTYGDFATLANPGSGPPFLDGAWEEGCLRQGYLYSLTEISAQTFTCYADPQTPGSSGGRFFRSDASGIIRWNAAARPTVADLPIGSS